MCSCQRKLCGFLAGEQQQEHKIAATSTEMLIMDRHPAYTADAFKTWAIEMGISLHISAGYSTTHVALVIRLHRTLREMLIKSCNQTDDWVSILPYMLNGYNQTPHMSTGFPPVQVLTGRMPRIKIDRILGMRLKPSAIEYSEALINVTKRRQQVFKAIVATMNETKERALKKYWNTRSSSPRSVQPGDLVFIRSKAKHIKLGKLQVNHWFGPYDVI